MSIRCLSVAVWVATHPADPWRGGVGCLTPRLGVGLRCHCLLALDPARRVPTILPLFRQSLRDPCGPLSHSFLLFRWLSDRSCPALIRDLRRMNAEYRGSPIQPPVGWVPSLNQILKLSVLHRPYSTSSIKRKIRIEINSRRSLVP